MVALVTIDSAQWGYFSEPLRAYITASMRQLDETLAALGPNNTKVAEIRGLYAMALYASRDLPAALREFREATRVLLGTGVAAAVAVFALRGGLFRAPIPLDRASALAARWPGAPSAEPPSALAAFAALGIDLELDWRETYTRIGLDTHGLTRDHLWLS